MREFFSFFIKSGYFENPQSLNYLSIKPSHQSNKKQPLMMPHVQAKDDASVI